MDAFAEAVRAVFASCNIGIVAVSTVAIALSRGAPRVIAAVVGSAIVGGWLFAQGVPVPFESTGGTIVHVVILGSACVGVFLLRHRPWFAAGLAALAQFMAVAWWRPCVGLAFADILNSGGFATRAIPMALYMLGLLVPSLIVGAAMNLFAPGGQHPDEVDAGDTERADRADHAGSADRADRADPDPAGSVGSA